MLGALNKVLLKLCDPRNSVSSSNASPRPSSAVMFGIATHSSTVGMRRQQEEPADTTSSRTHNFQSAINQLPYELLAEMFTTICHADSDQFLGDRNRHKKTTPLVLGSVCSHWRTVVWNNPQIWSHISLCLSSPSGRYATQVSLLKEWFERSGICPLTMNITFHNEDDWTKKIAHDLINLLVEQAYRWRSINFVLPESWYPFLECIKDNVNQLTTVSTQPLSADCIQSPSKRKRLTLFENAPLLNDLHLNGYYLTDVFLRWPQLTRITLQQVYLDECFYALPLLPNLTWCRVYTILINDVNRIFVDPDQPILLNQLKKMIVYRAAWGDLMRLLSSISCVLLESFEISALLDDLVFPQLSTVLPQFTTDNHRPSMLTRLVLSELGFRARPAFQVEPELKALLRDMPMLEELEIDINKKAECAFCSWWFIDLLGVQDPGGESKVGPGKGKERGWSPNCDDVSDDELLEGKGRSFGFRPSSQDHARSSLGSRETVSLSPCYILPNLHIFTFSGTVVHTCTTCGNNPTSNENCSFASPHPPSFHLSARVGEVKDIGFSRALLDILRTRGGFGSEWLDVSPEKVLLEEQVKSSTFEDSTLEATTQMLNDDIYFLDDEDKILVLPADVLAGPQSSRSITTPTINVITHSNTSTEFYATGGPGPISPPARLQAKSPPLNLRNNLETFTLKATTYRSMPSTTKGWSRCCISGMIPSDEVRAGLRKLADDGGMKLTVVLGGDAWV
jgi:hypothetical protein